MTGMIIERGTRYLWLTDAEFMEVSAILQAIGKIDEARKITFSDVEEDVAKLIRERLDDACEPMNARLTELADTSSTRDRIVSKITAGEIDDLDTFDREHFSVLRRMKPDLFGPRVAA